MNKRSEEWTFSKIEIFCNIRNVTFDRSLLKQGIIFLKEKMKGNNK